MKTSVSILVLLIAVQLSSTCSAQRPASNSQTNAEPAVVIAGPWQTDDMLSPIDAPQIAGHPLCVMADIDATGDQGVIISQGASGSGFSLHLKDGKPAFAIRIKNQLTAVVGEKPLGKGRHHLRAELKKDGSVTLSVDVSEVASGKAPGLIADQPMRGLTVGSSYFAVGDYPAKSVFPGRVENAYVQTF